MEVHLAKGSVLIIEGKNPRTGKPITRREEFSRVVVSGSTEAEWRAAFKYHRCFTGDARLRAKKLDADGKVQLEHIESVCRLGLSN